MIGTTISHYQVLEKLGEGGMGVVYKAQDTKLNRTVAIKMLPDRVNKDETAKARFLQEAQAAAGLNHPNICTVHGVEEVDGSLFMVMEYVEGGTLRDKLPFAKTDEAVTIAIQIGEALQEAHAKNIVHRDVKADNVMLTSRGQAKVMDFGLAKLKGTLKLTRTSSTVGTLGYMAPEQIQGGETDHRSDIFSFGVLLFEMLTGKVPFRGEHEAAMMYSILNEEPQSIQQLLPHASPELQHLFSRILEKDPADRYQTMADITSELRRLQKKTSRITRASATIPISSPGTAPSTMASAPTGVIATTFLQRKPIVIGGGLLFLAILASTVWLLTRSSLPRVNEKMEITTLQIPATEYQYPGISPDGKWVTFPGADLNGKWDIYMMLIETGENKRITTDSSQSLGNAATSRFSPDGTSIIYSRRNRRTGVAEVCVVSVLTGQSRVIADTGVAPQWSPAGDKIIYYRIGTAARFPGRTRWREYWSVSPQGGDAAPVLIDSLGKGGSTFFSTGISPDGKKIVFTRPIESGRNEMFTYDMETKKEQQLTFDDKDIDEAVWGSNGYIFFTSNRSGNFNIWVIPENGGEPTQVTSGAGPDNGVTYSAAANRLVFSQRTNVSTLWMVNTDGSGHRQVFPDENIQDSHLSPDGNTIALALNDQKMLPALMIREISGGRQEFLFPFEANVGRVFPRWSSSGNSISYVEFTRGSRQGYAKILDLAGGRRVRELGEGFVNQWISDSVVQVFRNSSRDTLRPNYSIGKLLNLNTNEESFFFKDSVSAAPALKYSVILYEDGPVLRLLPVESFRRNPAAQGRVIVRIDEVSAGFNSDTWGYFRYAARNALWKIDLRTLQRSKVIDLHPGDNIQFGGPDYNDKVIMYSIQKLKTKIMKIDKVFLP